MRIDFGGNVPEDCYYDKMKPMPLAKKPTLLLRRKKITSIFSKISQMLQQRPLSRGQNSASEAKSHMRLEAKLENRWKEEGVIQQNTTSNSSVDKINGSLV